MVKNKVRNFTPNENRGVNQGRMQQLEDMARTKGQNFETKL
jgi:hypothetical protein